MIYFIYGKEPFEIACDLPVSAALRRLKKATSSTQSVLVGAGGLRGSFDEDRVTLQRHVPLVHNPLKPVMVFNLYERDEKTVLQGAFRISWPTQIFLSCWFGLIALLLLVTALPWLGNSEAATYMPVYCLVMLSAGAGIVSAGKWLARHDKQWLMGKVEAALK